MQRRVLYFSNAHLTAYRVHGAQATPEGEFAGDAAGMTTFAAYLAQRQRSLFMLLVDSADESYQSEDIPYCSGKDRQAIIRRKLAQHFYGTPYALALSQGHLKTGRRNERLLLMALTQPQHLTPWLDMLRDKQAILTGIYALPQTLTELPVVRTTPSLLLLTLTRAGLRQSYFTAGLLRFSRLTPLIHDSADATALAAATEAARMHQYLASQHLIDRDKPLATCLLAHPAELAAMRARCQNTAQLKFEVRDLLAEAAQVGLRSALTSSHAEMLFCHLLVKRPPATQFARAEERGQYRLWQLRSALRAASAVICAGALLFAANRGMDILQAQDATELERLQAELNRHQYLSKLATLPKIPLGADDLRAFIDRYDEVAKRAQGPTPLLVQLSRSLDAFPQIILDQIEWSITDKLVLDTPAGMGTPVPSGPARGPFAQITAMAHLPLGMIGDSRGQLALVADFAKHLGTTPATTVTILQPPIDTQSGKILKSGEAGGTPEAPRFSFRLTHPL